MSVFKNMLKGVFNIGQVIYSTTYPTVSPTRRQVQHSKIAFHQLNTESIASISLLITKE